MDVDNLFEEYDINGEPIFFVDEDCLQPFSGHIEEYDRGFLCMESDVVEGFLDGVYKEYFFLKKKLQLISNVKKNMSNGLSIEFYENGMVQSLSLVIDNEFFDSYQYDENGKLIDKRIWSGQDESLLNLNTDGVRVTELREEYNLEQINEEILRDGINFDYKKYFRE